MEKNIIVLGANGFVGSHVVDRLAHTPDSQVYCFDRFSRPNTFEDAPNVHIIGGDFFRDGDVDKVLKYGGYLVHCFSSTNPRLSDNDPYADIELLKRNVEVFERAVAHGIEKVAFISSGGAIYGQPEDETPSTEDSQTQPVSPYGIAKLATENYLAYFKQKFDLPYVVYRLTNPYGPGQHFKNGLGVIPAFVEKIQNNDPITILGDGKASRDYVFISDAVDMISSSLFIDNKHAVYNIGSGKQTSLNEIIRVLEDELGHKIKIEHKEAPATFLQRTDVSIDRFCDEFGTPHLTSFEDGIAKTIGSFDGL